MEDCIVRGCKGKNGPNIKLFRFPKTNEIFWCHNLKISPDSLTTSSRICSRHFNKECGEKLRSFAMPTLELGHNDDSLSLHYPIAVEPPPIIRKRKCHVKDCGVTNPPHKLYRFPKCQERRNKWMAICQVEDKYLHLKLFFICKMHFRPDMIGKDKLRAHATPFPYTLRVKEKLDKNSERRCHVKFCKEADMQNKLHELPKDERIRNEWIANCNIDEKYLQLEHLFVCEHHYQCDVIDRAKRRATSLPSINMCNNVWMGNDNDVIRDENLCNVEISIGEEIEHNDEIIIKEEFLSNDEYSDEEFESASAISKKEIMVNEPNLIERNMVNKKAVCTNGNFSKFINMENDENAAYLDIFEPTLLKEQIGTVLPKEKINPEHEIAGTTVPSACIIKTEILTITEIICEKCGQSSGLETQMKTMEENFKLEKQMFLKRIQDLENELKRLKTND